MGRIEMSEQCLQLERTEHNSQIVSLRKSPTGSQVEARALVHYEAWEIPGRDRESVFTVRPLHFHLTPKTSTSATELITDRVGVVLPETSDSLSGYSRESHTDRTHGIRAGNEVMAAEEVVVMRWPLHSGELLQNLSAMRERGEMNDVTLITPDGSVEAHRVILAASSEFLRDLLRKSPAFVPCSVVLRDITMAQLSLVLDFVYKGELAVLKTQLNDLARACDYLQIKTCLSSLETTEDACQLYGEDNNESGGNDNDCGDNENENGDHDNAGEDDEDDEDDSFIERQPEGKDTTTKASWRAKAKPSAELSANEPAPDKIPISAEDVDMEELHSSAVTYEVITYEDVKDEVAAADEVKPKSRQSYAKKARLSIVGDKRVYTLDDEKLANDSSSQMGPDRRYCRECRITLSYPKEFREHRKQWHALMCARCDFRATKESTVREHFEKVHENIRRFSCDACPFQCKDRATLLNHSRRHTNEKPYECGYCDYKSAQSASMKQHVTLHENVESRPFPCDECTRHPISFGSRAALTKHKKAHH